MDRLPQLGHLSSEEAGGDPGARSTCPWGSLFPRSPSEPLEAYPPPRDRSKDRQQETSWRNRVKLELTGWVRRLGLGRRRSQAALTGLSGRPGGFYPPVSRPQSGPSPGRPLAPPRARLCARAPRPAGHQPGAQFGTGPSREVPGAVGNTEGGGLVDRVPGDGVMIRSASPDTLSVSSLDQGCVPFTSWH